IGTGPFYRLTRSTPSPPLFPYTTLFRSPLGVEVPIGEPIVLGDAIRRAVRIARERRAVWPAPHPARRDHPGIRRSPASARELLRSEEHTSELQSRENLVCRLLLA